MVITGYSEATNVGRLCGHLHFYANPWEDNMSAWAYEIEYFFSIASMEMFYLYILGIDRIKCLLRNVLKAIQLYYAGKIIVIKINIKLFFKLSKFVTILINYIIKNIFMERNFCTILNHSQKALK